MKLKKVKLKLSYDAANAIYADLFNNVGKPVVKNYINIMRISLLTELYFKLSQRVLIRTDKPIALSMSIAEAAALLLHASASPHEVTSFLGNTYLQVINEIDQQIT